MATRLWNGSTQPLVPSELGWGNGVVMPGESFTTDKPETYASPPWSTDPEADARLEAAQAAAREALQGLVAAEAQVSSIETSENVTEAPVAPDGTPDVHVNPNGDVVNESGQVVGHLDA